MLIALIMHLFYLEITIIIPSRIALCNNHYVRANSTYLPTLTWRGELDVQNWWLVARINFVFVSEKSFYNSVRSWRVTNPNRSKGHLPREQHFLLLAAVVEKKTPFQVSLPLSLCLRTHTQQTGLRSLTPKRTLHSLYFSLSLSRFLPHTHFHVLSLSLSFTHWRIRTITTATTTSTATSTSKGRT